MLQTQIESPEVMRDEELSKQRESFFDEADSAFLIFDEHLFLLDCNTAFLQERQQKKADLLGRHISAVFSGELKSERLEKYRDVLHSDQPFYCEEMRSHPLKGSYFIQTKAFRVGNGLGIVNKKRWAEKESLVDLETFICKSSHELRGPLARILGILNLSEDIGNDVGTAKNFFRIIKQQAEHLDVILKTLVQSTDVRKLQTDDEPVEFWTILENVLSDLQFVQGFHEVRFEKMISFSSPFFSDRKILNVLFHQLIENAVKYRKQDGSQAIVKISINEEDLGATIVIQDNGIGIPVRLQDKVFQLFYRPEQKQQGSGLGLFAVRQLVKKLNGKITLKSESNLGCEFSIFLPWQQRLKAIA